MLFIAIVYCIIAKGSNLIYYGSTIKSKEIRFSKHKCELNCASRQILSLPNCRIEELCRFENEDKDELIRQIKTIEKGCILKHRRQYPGECVNKNLPFVTEEERKEFMNKYNKQWQLDNRVKRNRQATERKAKNRDEVNRQQNERRAKNRDEVNRKERELRAKNRDENNRKQRERNAKNRDEYNRKARERRAKKKLVDTLFL